MITILLATYNGEKYIAGLIESLMSQTVKDFKLYIRDDKSTDATFSIITGYAEKYPGKIFASQNEENAGGAKYNFMEMMIDHKDDYVMLCDQDDVWFPDKIEKSLNKIKEIEKETERDINQKTEPATPVMVHTDLVVVKENLNVISSSYEKMSNKDFEKTSLSFVVTMNNAAGCTIIYNRALADMIQAMPEFIVMHDWWVSLIASAFGRIKAIHIPMVQYRQHEDSVSGAKKVLSFKYIYYVLKNLKIMSSMIDDSYKQAGAFLKMYGASEYKDKLSADKSKLLSAYSSIPYCSRRKRFQTVKKYKTYMHGFARKTAQMMILFTGKEKGRREKGSGTGI